MTYRIKVSFEVYIDDSCLFSDFSLGRLTASSVGGNLWLNWHIFEEVQKGR